MYKSTYRPFTYSRQCINLPTDHLLICRNLPTDHLLIQTMYKSTYRPFTYIDNV